MEAETVTCLAGYLPNLSMGFCCQYGDKVADERKTQDVLRFISECGLAGADLRVRTDAELSIKRLAELVAQKKGCQDLAPNRGALEPRGPRSC